jgi:methionyl-tRNA formyltransferase
MIYLFTNRSYGAPFIAAATAYAGRTGAAVTVVYSERRGVRRRGATPGSVLRSLASKVLGPKSAQSESSLPEITVADVNAPEFVAEIAPADAGIIAGFDQIFSRTAIGRFASFVNVHPSLLPFYRGPEPAYWCIAYGESVTGFTIHNVTERIDVGETQYQERLDIEPFETPASLSLRLAVAAVPAFEKWLDHIAAGSHWEQVSVDAAAAYRTHVDYRSFHYRTGAAGK